MTHSLLSLLGGTAIHDPPYRLDKKALSNKDGIASDRDYHQYLISIYSYLYLNHCHNLILDDDCQSDPNVVRQD